MTALFLWLISSTVNAQFFSNKTQELLPEDQAFQVVTTIDGNTVRVNWVIAQGYYMYREQFRIESSNPNITIGELIIPQGSIENDPEFGEVEVYFFNADISAPIQGPAGEIELIIKGQGCNKPVGVCYPPLVHKVSVDFQGDANLVQSPGSATNSSTTASIGTITTSKNNSAPIQTPSKSFWGYVLGALVAGWLLSFTPCVLPMIPILAGVIAGQKQPSRMQSGWLSICYVFGTIVTYAIAGWVAGATGTQLQAHFQNPWVIGTICLILIALAFSLFGAYKIQLPSSIQTKLNGTQVNNRSASISSFILGLISALVVGACVSPILIITLGAAITQGDPILGSAIMSAMALGMGTLLILFGFGAGWLLPKAGAWMEHVQRLFGFMVLGVAIFIASSVATVPTLLLWAALLIMTGFYLLQMGKGDSASAIITAVIKALAFISILWGALALIGGSLNKNGDILSPLDGINFQSTNNTQLNDNLVFDKVTTLAQANQLLNSAKQAGKPVMVDFYADWCLDCKRMHKSTYKKPSVIDALSGWKIIEIDVTETSDDSEEVKRAFNVFGPPATLFFQAKGDEINELRQYGYMNENVFLSVLEKTGS